MLDKITDEELLAVAGEIRTYKKAGYQENMLSYTTRTIKGTEII